MLPFYVDDSVDPNIFYSLEHQDKLLREIKAREEAAALKKEKAALKRKKATKPQEANVQSEGKVSGKDEE